MKTKAETYEIVEAQWAECDLCGSKTTETPIYRSQHSLYLCGNCICKLREMPDWNRANIENYLLGNVF